MPFQSTAPCTSVVIAGAGGFALELYDYVAAEAASGGPRVRGFLLDPQYEFTATGVDVPVLGPIDEYGAREREAVLVAVGTPEARSAVHRRLAGRGAWLSAYVHPSAVVSPSARLGAGALICPFAIVNRNAVLGEGVLVNVHGSVGHGAAVGDFSVLSPYAALNGDTSIGALCFLGTRATINPRIRIGNRCVVDTHTAVRSATGDGQMISSRGTYRVDPRR